MNSKTPKKGKAEKTDTVEKSPALNDVVMPAVIENHKDRYYVVLQDGGFYTQFKNIDKRKDPSIYTREIVIKELCETILKMKA